MPNFKEISNKLHLSKDGIWYSTKKSPISYPAEANLWCGQVEADSYWFKHRNQVILEILQRFPPKGWIADIGGGNGYVAQFLQQAGYEVVLIEPGKDGIRLAHQRGIQYIVGTTLQDAEFMPNSIPAAGLFDTLEHIRDDFILLKNLQTMLHPGGRLYITVPAYSLLRSIEDNYVGHLHRYSRKSLIRLIESAGFVVDFSTYFFTFLIFPIFFLRSLPYRLGLVRNFNEKWFIRQLKPGIPLLDHVSNRLVNWELKPLARKKSIPFGASLIVMAHKK